MNYLAHAFLSNHSSLDLVGNIYGDFIKGVDLSTLPIEIQNGIQHHQKVDKFTDTHAIVLELKTHFPAQYRRFAPIALDILFDHFLAKHWMNFSDIPLPYFCQRIYQAFELHEDLMNSRMIKVTGYVRRNNWLENYKDLNYTAVVLDQMAERIRFKNDFKGLIAAIPDKLEYFEQQFFVFFEDLKLNLNKPNIGE
jgi:acyl carrier protein phosphodiesterase